MKISRPTFLRVLVSGIGILAVLTLFFLATRPRPLVIFPLADGTQVAVASLEAGKEFHMYHGSSMQESLFKVLGDRVPPRFVGSQSTIPATLTNATGKSLAVVLRRFGAQGFIGSPWNGQQLLTVTDEHGKEINGLLRSVHFDTDVLTETTKVTREQVVWEFPMSNVRELQFRLYDTNGSTGSVSTNGFVLTNPATQ